MEAALLPLLKNLVAVGELAWSYRVHAGLPEALNEAGLRQLQLERLNATVAWAREHCAFYAGRLPLQPLGSLDELRRLPLMDWRAFAGGLAPLLGVEHSVVSRIVTLATSGTTSEPKRIAFTANEHADIVDYLASGMRMLAAEGETIAVLYPCDRSGGLGRLICESIASAGRRVCAYGLPDTRRGFAHLAHTCSAAQVKGMVGFPQHIFALARWCEHHSILLPIHGVLLSADNVASALKREIARIWHAQVFAHYGTTEMGYGGAVECPHGTGQHIRETDLLFEIIDPESGEVLPDGAWGELVFTTLNRRAMPFIRYRSGDRTRLLPGSCSCGSVLRRVDTVSGHVDAQLPLTLHELEDVVFALPGVLDFEASWRGRRAGRDGTGGRAGGRDGAGAALALNVQLLPGFELDAAALCAALEDRAGSAVRITCSCSTADGFAPLYSAKRTIRRHVD